jgi:hypothetical protein
MHSWKLDFDNWKKAHEKLILFNTPLLIMIYTKKQY